jgi:hypothetical protein
MAVQQLDKHRWQLDCKAGQPVELHWQVCAYDTSVRTAWLDSRRGFFNGTSLCLRVHGQERTPHALECPLCRHPGRLAAGHGPDAPRGGRQGFGLYWRPTTTSWWTARWKWAPSGAALHRLRRAPPLCGGRRRGQL